MSQQYKPKIGSKYYVIFKMHNSVSIDKKTWENSDTDIEYYNNQNCFRSKKQAEIMIKLFGSAW